MNPIAIKIAAVLAVALASFITLPQIFSFSDGSPQAAQPFDARQSFSDINDWLWEMFTYIGSSITSSFKSLLPNSSPTFGIMVTVLTFLILLYMLSSRFEGFMRALIMVAGLIATVMLILSAVGFV